MPVYGYARVSTCGQELGIQLAQLGSAGCDRIYREKESGARDDRRELARLLKALKPGDVVIVVSLDRLTRSGPYRMLAVLDQITSRGAAYRSLAEPWADTTHEFGEVLAAIVGYMAKKYREDSRRLSAAGRAQAKARGVIFGRRPKLSLLQRQQALARRAAGESPAAIARSYEVSPSTILRLGKKSAAGCFSA